VSTIDSVHGTSVHCCGRITARIAVSVYIVATGSYGGSERSLPRIRRLERLVAAEMAVRQAKRSPRRSRLRPSHSVKRPDCLRHLAPQSRFVPAHAVKQGWVKIGKAQKTLGDGAGLRPSTGRRPYGRCQRFVAIDRRILMCVRAGAFAMSIGPVGSLERPGLT
jgi:hypothetical protein